MDEDVLIGKEQSEPLLDPCSDVCEQTHVVTGSVRCSLNLLERRAHDGRVERGPWLASERVPEPRREQIGRDRNAVESLQCETDAFDHGPAGALVRRWPDVVQGPTRQSFGDVPGAVRAVPMSDVTGVRDVTAFEHPDDSRLVVVRIAEASLADPHHVLVANPGLTHPAGLRNEVSFQRQTRCREDPA